LLGTLILPAASAIYFNISTRVRSIRCGTGAALAWRREGGKRLQDEAFRMAFKGRSFHSVRKPSTIAEA
jgi:hypothetical protein